LEFGVQLFGTSTGDTANYKVRFQNNIQSIFSRVRLLYGSTPIEDIINYNVIVRNLTEWTGTNQLGTMDQCSIAEGIGGATVGTQALGTSPQTFGDKYINVRQNYVQGIDTYASTAGQTGAGYVPNHITGSGTPDYCQRRYQVNFALGLFTQDKLVFEFFKT